jgi:aspartate aminotransferase-like enzyme/ribosomal protein S18 acetylase RimI-like enzyme
MKYSYLLIAQPETMEDPPPGIACRPRELCAVELAAVRDLIARTFVTELGQHPGADPTQYVDKHDGKSDYLVVLCAGEVVGLLALSDSPPWSVAARLPPGALENIEHPLEIRLLAIDPGHRRRPLTAALAARAWTLARYRGARNLVISALVEREALYRGFGFEPLGPAVAEGRAHFVPMRLEVTRNGDLPPTARRLAHRYLRQFEDEVPENRVSLLPGPPQSASDVLTAYRRQPHYHRDAEFLSRFERVRSSLCELTGGRHRVALLTGGGTTANDAVGLALRGIGGPGLVPVNGEFGGRLVDQLRRAGIAVETLEYPWGTLLDLDAIERRLARGGVGFVWATHCETSTGMLNDLGSLRSICHRHGVPLALDAVSTVGAVPLDLDGVVLASGTASKAIGGVAGISWVWAEPDFRFLRDVPSSLDLGAAMARRGPRHTFASSPLAALDRALEAYATPGGARRRFARYRELGLRVRSGLTSLGRSPLVPWEHASPVVTTFHAPEGDSEALVERARSWGFDLAGASEYLVRRGWAQIATLGEVRNRDLDRFFEAWKADGRDAASRRPE